MSLESLNNNFIIYFASSFFKLSTHLVNNPYLDIHFLMCLPGVYIKAKMYKLIALRTNLALTCTQQIPIQNELFFSFRAGILKYNYPKRQNKFTNNKKVHYMNLMKNRCRHSLRFSLNAKEVYRKFSFLLTSDLQLPTAAITGTEKSIISVSQ